MTDETELQDQLHCDPEHQLDFTETANFLHQIAALTKTMLEGPTTPDEDIWSTQAMTHWNRSNIFVRCCRAFQHGLGKRCYLMQEMRSFSEIQLMLGVTM